MWPFSKPEPETFEQANAVVQENFQSFSQMMEAIHTHIMQCVEKGESTEKFFTEIQNKNPDVYKNLAKGIKGGESVSEDSPLPSPSQLADQIGVSCIDSIRRL
jgi:hypothetical protein